MFRGRSVAALFALLTLGWLVAASGPSRGCGRLLRSSPHSTPVGTVQPSPRRRPLRSNRFFRSTASPATTSGSRPPASRSTRSTSTTPARESGGLGARDREAARGLDAAGRDGRGPTRRPYHAVAGWLEARHRSRVGRASQSRPRQRGPSPQSHRVQQRRPRSVRARSAAFDVKSLLPGDETADGSFDNFADVAVDLDGASRALSVGRRARSRGWRRACRRASPALDDVRDSAARRAGRSAERRPAVRIARRHRDSLRRSRSTAST